MTNKLFLIKKYDFRVSPFPVKRFTINTLKSHHKYITLIIITLVV